MSIGFVISICSQRVLQSFDFKYVMSFENGCYVFGNLKFRLITYTIMNVNDVLMTIYIMCVIIRIYDEFVFTVKYSVGKIKILMTKRKRCITCVRHLMIIGKKESWKESGKENKRWQFKMYPIEWTR